MSIPIRNYLTCLAFLFSHSCMFTTKLGGCCTNYRMDSYTYPTVALHISTVTNSPYTIPYMFCQSICMYQYIFSKDTVIREIFVVKKFHFFKIDENFFLEIFLTKKFHNENLEELKLWYKHVVCLRVRTSTQLRRFHHLDNHPRALTMSLLQYFKTAN